MYEKQDSTIWVKYIRDIFISQTITCSQCANYYQLNPQVVKLLPQVNNTNKMPMIFKLARIRLDSRFLIF